MSEPVTEEDIVRRIDGEISSALGYGDAVSEQRREALHYYYARPFGNEVEGRSHFVDSTVTGYCGVDQAIPYACVCLW